MTKRVHYPVRKDKIAEAIELYNKYTECMFDIKMSKPIWEAFYEKAGEISPFTHCRVAIPSLFQAMEFAGTLTVDNVYNAIIVAGINTKLEEVNDA